MMDKSYRFAIRGKLALLPHRFICYDNTWRFLTVAICLGLPSIAAIAQSSTSRDAFRIAMRQGIAFARAGHYRSAQAAFETATSLRPANPLALTALGEVEDQDGHSRQSINVFRRVIELNPKSADAHINLAIALADDGHLSAALNQDESAIRIDPRSSLAHFTCGRLLDSLGRVKEAETEFRVTLSISPRYYKALLEWARLEKSVGNIPEEVKLLKRYVGLSPTANAYWRLGEAFQEEGRYQDAVVAWERAHSMAPDNTRVLYSLGRALRKTSPPRSRQLLHHLAIIKQDHYRIDRANLMGNHGNAEIYAGHYRKAVKDFKAALAICGNCSVSWALHENLGLAYCHAGQLSDGIHELHIAATLKPNDPSILKALKLATNN